MRVWITRGADEPRVELHYYYPHELNVRRINLAGELDMSGGETVSLFLWAESAGHIRPRYGGVDPGGNTAIGVPPTCRPRATC